MPPLSEIMTTDPVSADATASVAEVAERMLKGRFGSVLVLQGSWLAGIFTERDVLRAAASGSDLTATPISAWMTKDPVTAAPATESDEAAEIMLTNGFRHLPVVDGNTILGIVSLRDILSTRIRKPAR